MDFIYKVINDIWRLVIPIKPQSDYVKNNVAAVSGTLFFIQINDPEKYAIMLEEYFMQ